VRLAAQREEGFGERLLLSAARAEAETGDHSGGRDRQEQADALEPAQAVAPADVGEARQPAGAAPLGIPGRHGRGVDRFVGRGRGAREPGEGQQAGDQGAAVPWCRRSWRLSCSRARRQRREGAAQAAGRA
jgi:hypothetical protein